MARVNRECRSQYSTFRNPKYNKKIYFVADFELPLIDFVVSMGEQTIVTTGQIAFEMILILSLPVYVYIASAIGGASLPIEILMQLYTIVIPLSFMLGVIYSCHNIYKIKQTSANNSTILPTILVNLDPTNTGTAM
jgi:hypothetical protein